MGHTTEPLHTEWLLCFCKLLASPNEIKPEYVCCMSPNSQKHRYALPSVQDATLEDLCRFYRTAFAKYAIEQTLENQKSFEQSKTRLVQFIKQHYL